MLTSNDPELASLHPLYISPELWDELARVCEFLSPLEMLTDSMCKDSYPTSPLIIKMFNNLYDYFDAIVERDEKVKFLCSDVIAAAANSARAKLNRRLMLLLCCVWHWTCITRRSTL